MTELEKAKIMYSDACISLEISQGKHTEAKTKLIQEINKETAAKKEVPKVPEEGPKK